MGDSKLPNIPLSQRMNPNSTAFEDFVSEKKPVGRDWKPPTEKKIADEVALNNVGVHGDYFIPATPPVVIESPLVPPVAVVQETNEGELQAIREIEVDPELSRYEKAQRIRRLKEKIEKKG